MFGKIALVAASLAAFGQATNLDNYTFEKFVAQFDMHYHPSEVPARKALFEAELARVKTHNAQNKSWKETITRFSAMTPAEKTASYGRKASKDHQLKAAAKLVTDLKMRPVSELPASVDWRTHTPNVVTAVKDQGYCGSCWAFASTAVIESHVALSTGLLFDLSPQQIAMCSPNPNHCGGSGGCEGATAEIAFEYVAGAGIFEEWQYSYQSYYGKDYACSIPPGSPVASIESYVKLPENNYTALMNAIATVGPIAVSVDASAWSAYSGGVFNGCNQAKPDIDHAVVLMGYGEENGQKYWLVRNSWAPTWGELGYIKLLRTDAEEENCGMDTTPHDGSACDGQDEPVKVCGTCGILYDSSYPTGAKTA